VQPLVFIVEDDPDIVQLMQHSLTTAGFETRAFLSAAEVLKVAERQAPALFLLDIMLPGRSGLDVCAAIRKHAQLAKVPVIFVTAKAAEADRIAGLELGADDYVTKPFSPRELIARVRAVLRRFQPSNDGVIHAGSLTIDPAAMNVTINDQPIVTTATEFRLLEYLARRPGRVYTRDQLLDAVWGDSTFVTPRSVDVYIRRLREKIETDAEQPVLLRTVRGAGYKFEGHR
jgi:DNA-binding response OmpR family regulator